MSWTYGDVDLSADPPAAVRWMDTMASWPFVQAYKQRTLELLAAPGATSGARLLDVGCGTGANLQMLARHGAAEGVDVSSEALEFCRARGLSKVKEGAAEALPYEDASFDLVTGLDVVEHLDDDVAGLKEMRRVLRPRGRAL